MYSKWHISKEFRCCSSNLSQHYLTSCRLLELRYISYHLNLSAPSFLIHFDVLYSMQISIHHRPVTHSRMSSTARREVVAPTPTTQTMGTAWLDVFL
jgi:hypothetical protein